MEDLEYKNFHSRLIPNVPAERIIGIRVPVLRKYVKSLKDEEMIASFLHDLPHRYYEENNVHAFLIERCKSFDQCVEELERFLPYVDNWATCDSMLPKVLRKEKERLIQKIAEWIHREDEYAVRFGIKLLMDFFLEDDFQEEYLYWAAGVQREEYYIRMMQSWYVATALAKQYDAAVRLLHSGVLSDWVHNKAIQKAIESRRISKEQKDYLRTQKRPCRGSGRTVPEE